jgi:hypothetical protein
VSRGSTSGIRFRCSNNCARAPARSLRSRPALTRSIYSTGSRHFLSAWFSAMRWKGYVRRSRRSVTRMCASDARRQALAQRRHGRRSGSVRVAAEVSAIDVGSGFLACHNFIYRPSTRRLFFTENAPGTPLALMPARSLSPCVATTPSKVTFPFSTMIWTGGTACNPYRSSPGVP